MEVTYRGYKIRFDGVMWEWSTGGDFPPRRYKTLDDAKLGVDLWLDW